MAVHPHCPCTRATLEELNRLLAQISGKLPIHLLFVRPPGLTSKWTETDLWRNAQSVPGVNVMMDVDGTEAKRFCLATSGQVVFYDREGRLRFTGGITPSRGHAGDSAGQAAIIALVERGESELGSSPAFGCPLFSPGAEEATPCR